MPSDGSLHSLSFPYQQKALKTSQIAFDLKIEITDSFSFERIDDELLIDTSIEFF